MKFDDNAVCDLEQIWQCMSRHNGPELALHGSLSRVTRREFTTALSPLTSAADATGIAVAAAAAVAAAIAAVLLISYFDTVDVYFVSAAVADGDDQ